MWSRGALFTLADLRSPFAWSQRSDLDASYEYAVATEAVSFLRADLGFAGVLRIFALLAQGEAFEDAYAAVAGRSFDEFTATFPERVQALAPLYPAIVTVPDSPGGAGLTFIVFGLPANATVSYSVTGPSNSVPRTVSLDAYGFYYTYVGNTWPAGTYTMTLTWSGGTLTGTGTKPQ
jgi:hypothetical protein